jgi:hypothetical protein
MPKLHNKNDMQGYQWLNEVVLISWSICKGKFFSGRVRIVVLFRSITLIVCTIKNSKIFYDNFRKDI